MLKAHFARLDSWPGPRTESREEGAGQTRGGLMSDKS